MAGIIIGLFSLALVVRLIDGFTLGENENNLSSSSASHHGKKNRFKHAFGDNTIAWIEIQGMISEEGDDGVFSDKASAPSAYRKLLDAAEDNSVKGVLLRINSPGGTVGMSQELYQAVGKVRAVKPVVVSMGDLAASGGYYTASAADKIVANPGTLTASIGVILHSMNVGELLTHKLGVKPVTIKSGKYKDILSPYRDATKDEVVMLQSLINSSYHQFLSDVIKGRTQDIKEVDKKSAVAQAITSIADGRVVEGSQALQYYLIDQVGSSQDAIDLLKQLISKKFNIRSIDSIDVDRHYGRPSFSQLFGAEVFSGNILNSLFQQAQQNNSLSDSLKPSTLKFANQPLWLMESLN